MAPTGKAYHIDWIFSNNANVHVANHRDWFTTFTEFKSKLADGQNILGIGDVELEVKTHLSRKGSSSHRTLVLKDVLFVPSCICNILGGPILKEYEVMTAKTGSGLKDHKTNGSMGLFDRVVLWKLWLVGHRQGESSLDPDMMYYITAEWPKAEMDRWALCKKMESTLKIEGPEKSEKVAENLNAQKPCSGGAEHHTPATTYTPAEKAWLRRGFGGEFKFLRAYGLSIYKDEDRAEGRAIARAMIEQDAKEEDEDDDEKGEEKNDKDDEEDAESENSFLADLEADPMSHLADRFFTEVQLDFIKKHYRHSGNFLLCHGLTPFEDEDCEEGVAIVRAFMTEDDE